MLYMLLIHSDETRYPKMSAEEDERMMAGYQRLTEDLEGAEALVASHRLRPTTTATTVRVRDEETLLTDGPFTETKEQFGGYYLIDVADVDEAIRWASRVPSAAWGCVEVRPVWEM